MAGFDPTAFGSLFWMAMTLVVAIIAVILFIVHERVILPPIARAMRKAKWSKSSPAFIQDDMGVVHFTINDTDLPEGVVHNKRGWFLRSRSPYLPRDVDPEDLKPIEEESNPKKKAELQKELMKKLEVADKEQDEALKTILQTPILEGLGKSVFYGYDGTALLSNLKTLAHADLRIMKEIIPATISRTQLGSLHRWSVQKGYEKRGGDTNKIVILAICVIGVIATVGLVFYFITQ